ncbi:glycosyl transferase, group 1 [Alkaliphilus metalliredigens QYMF]|uniref:Glycosyl transferase, group 1 n=1 Tax=Alkaliphilus metalliredigens (strain QYMF) TaxID=293826 RepID=A6TJS6_ALKMQ|nr:glycosyltransferase [Alkaliphilus metalliredigens]ABR46444.1 glycosyl transferase, group 1 [Alkaliphilus metalliredigens QYMF]
MYILIIARGYPTDKYKMNGIFEFDQAKALVQAGHKVIYAAIDVRSIRRWRKWGGESFEQDGVQVEAINIPGGRIPKTILRQIQMQGLKNLYKRIESKYGKPDIIHAHFLGYGNISTEVLAKQNIPIALTEHLSAMNNKALEPSLITLGTETYPNVDKLITVSEALANNIEEKFEVKATVIPNMVDTESFNYINRRKENDDYVFVSTGGLIPRKSMDVLIDSFNIAFKDKKKVKLYIFGEGAERSKLEQMIAEYKLTEQIFLMGLRDRKEIAKRMHESDCFVLVSKLETFGVAYIEALAAGLPVIATNCGGPEEFVHKDNGILIEVDDAEALTNSMLKMYNESNKFDREKISKEMVDKFSPEAIAKRLTETYRNVLKDRKVQL